MGLGNVDGNMDVEVAYGHHVEVVVDEDTCTLRRQEVHSEDDPAEVDVDGTDNLREHLESEGKVVEQKEVAVDDVHMVVAEGEPTSPDCTDQLAIDSETQIVDWALSPLIASSTLAA